MRIVDLSEGKEKRMLDFVLFLALYAPAPKYAPKDWFHHAEENFDAWKRFLEEAKERGYYELPCDKGAKE